MKEEQNSMQASKTTQKVKRSGDTYIIENPTPRLQAFMRLWRRQQRKNIERIRQKFLNSDNI